MKRHETMQVDENQLLNEIFHFWNYEKKRKFTKKETQKNDGNSSLPAWIKALTGSLINKSRVLNKQCRSCN
jgi:hypothetical protein